MNLQSTRTLNNGIEMPWLGFGVWKIDDDNTAQSVQWAIEAGYRHIDTAAIYGNEQGVGKGVHNSGIPREQLFITTKLWNEDIRAGREMQAFEESLKKLAMDYVDLYLIHWPVENFQRSWKVMEDILASGRAKAIGVCNFQPHHLDTLLADARVIPAINQIESHPYLTQQPLLKYCADKGIACQAWSPLGGSGAPLLEDEKIIELAQKHSKTPAQIVLRWDLQRQVTPLIKSANQQRIKSNTELYDFSLSEEEMAVLNGLNQNKRFGPDPENFDF